MAEHYGVYIPPAANNDEASPSGKVFTTLKEASVFANTPKAKSSGARFKRFPTLEDAQEFAGSGCVGGSPFPVGTCQVVFNSPTSPRCNEPTIELPSVSRIQQNRLKKAIENLDNAAFDEMAVRNPRYIINTSGDTPAIVVEGFRYNALHIAARVGNVHVVTYILDTVRNLTVLAALYGTDDKDAAKRSAWLLDMYLNTPDKGAKETPLHFAAKFGRFDIVRMLLELSSCNRNPRNNNGELPVDICCKRATPADSKKYKSAILALFQPVYVPLYRPQDCSSGAIIKPPGYYPPRTLSSNDSPLNTPYVLAAVAGPFQSEEDASKFHKEWISLEKEIRLRDPLKGDEKIGRNLAHQYKVRWMERWLFHSDIVDLNSARGLELLDAYLVKNLLGHTSKRTDDDVRKKLDFDEYEDDDIKSSHTDQNSHADTNNTAETEDKKGRDADGDDSGNGEDEDEFYEDTVEEFPEKTNLAGNQTPASPTDSLRSFIESMAALRLDSDAELDSPINSTASVVDSGDGTDGGVLNRIEQEAGNSSDDDWDMYATPPSSPPESLYLCEGIPSKEDGDLILALQLVDANLLREFLAISEYVYKVQRVSLEERSDWPSSDSPRARKRRHARSNRDGGRI